MVSVLAAAQPTYTPDWFLVISLLAITVLLGLGLFVCVALIGPKERKITEQLVVVFGVAFGLSAILLVLSVLDAIAILVDPHSAPCC